MSLCILLVYELQSRRPGKAVWREAFSLAWLSTSALCVMFVFETAPMKVTRQCLGCATFEIWLDGRFQVASVVTQLPRWHSFSCLNLFICDRGENERVSGPCGVEWGWISVFCSEAGVIFGTSVHPDANVKLRLTSGNSQLCCQIQWQELAGLSLILVLTRTPAVFFSNADKICVTSELDFKSH